MKILYIPAIQKNLNIQLDKKQISKLPKELFLAYSIQYQDLANNIAKQLEKQGIKIKQKKQVLGCSVVKTLLPILLVSSGRFHAQNLYLQTPILYVLEENNIIRIPQSEIDTIKAKKQAALIKFLKAERIGILVSTKQWQEHLDKAIKLKEKLEKQDKQAYVFISNNIDVSQFENFDIDSWINTACKGLSLDNPNIINIEDLPKANN